MSTKVFTYEEVDEHNTAEDLWLVINGKVYDCTKFLSQHPGGEESLLECAGGIDATKAFEDLGHSEDAREMLVDMLVGEIDGESSPISPPVAVGGASSDSKIPLLLTLLVALAGILYYLLMK